MKKITKKQSQIFFNEVIEVLKEKDWQEEPSKLDSQKHFVFYDFECGRIDLYLPILQDSSVYSVYTRFEHPELAFLGVCKYSGKCNFHEFDSKILLKKLSVFVYRFASEKELQALGV